MIFPHFDQTSYCNCNLYLQTDFFGLCHYFRCSFCMIMCCQYKRTDNRTLSDFSLLLSLLIRRFENGCKFQNLLLLRSLFLRPVLQTTTQNWRKNSKSLLEITWWWSNRLFWGISYWDLIAQWKEFANFPFMQQLFSHSRLSVGVSRVYDSSSLSKINADLPFYCYTTIRNAQYKLSYQISISAYLSYIRFRHKWHQFFNFKLNRNKLNFQRLKVILEILTKPYYYTGWLRNTNHNSSLFFVSEHFVSAIIIWESVNNQLLFHIKNICLESAVFVL